jgi:hypothetical protein
MKSPDERMAERLWEAYLKRTRLRHTQEEMVCLGLPFLEIRQSVLELEEALVFLVFDGVEDKPSG